MRLLKRALLALLLVAFASEIPTEMPIPEGFTGPLIALKSTSL